MACIKDNTNEFPVEMMCRILKVSTSRFYAWLKAPRSKRTVEDEKLSAKVIAVFEASRKTYGSFRIHAKLIKDGLNCGRNRIIKLMRAAGLKSKVKRKFKVTTDSKHSHPVAANILKRDFNPTSADKVWVQDITYITTGEGWLYLAVVIDLYSRKVVGYSMQEHMRKELVIDALDMALTARKPLPGLIAHSDRGSQYCSHLFQAKLGAYKMVCSMSGKGECWDNAVAESFFHTLKTRFGSF
jgi:transposase InsO family protein